MDFELLSESAPKPPSLLNLFERFLFNRKRQWQQWKEQPPHGLGISIFLLVVLEITFSLRLFQKVGISRSFFPQFFGLSILVLLVQMLVLLSSSKITEFMGKKASFSALWTTLNLGLAPLLLFLPISLLCWAIGDETALLMRGLVFLLLVLKVLSHWHEAIEINFGLSKVQSGIVMYVMGGLITGTVVFLIYVFFLQNIFSTLGIS